MEITDTMRMQTYENAPEIVRDAYGNEEIGGRLQQIFQHYGFDEQMYNPFVHIFGDHILGLIGKEELPAFVTRRLGADEATAQAVAADITKVVTGLAGLEEAIVPIKVEGDRSGSGSEDAEKTENDAEPEFLPDTPGNKTLQEEESRPQEESGDIDDTHHVPSYAKPLTDIPRYDTYEDPYHEKPE